MGGMHTSKSKTRKYFGCAAVYISVFSLFQLFFLKPVLFCSPRLLSKFKLPVPLNWLLTCTCVQGAPPFSPARLVCVRKAAGGLLLTNRIYKGKKKIGWQENREEAPEDSQLRACHPPAGPGATATVTNAPFLATLRRSSRFLSFA